MAARVSCSLPVRRISSGACGQRWRSMWHDHRASTVARSSDPARPRGHAMSENGTVLVTGSSRGIGRAIALRLARDGYDIVVHCRSRIADAESVAAEVLSFGRVARRLQFDVADRDQCTARIAADIEAHGAYYGVVCNAGLAHDMAFPAMSGDA